MITRSVAGYDIAPFPVLLVETFGLGDWIGDILLTSGLLSEFATIVIVDLYRGS